MIKGWDRQNYKRMVKIISANKVYGYIYDYLYMDSVQI